MTDPTLMGEATEAAALWNARLCPPDQARENAVFEIALPSGDRGALRLHRPGYQGEAAIASELWWCAELAARDLPVPAPVAIHVPVGARNVLSTGRMVSTVSWMDGAALGEAGRAVSRTRPGADRPAFPLGPASAPHPPCQR